MKLRSIIVDDFVYNAANCHSQISEQSFQTGNGTESTVMPLRQKKGIISNDIDLFSLDVGNAPSSNGFDLLESLDKANHK